MLTKYENRIVRITGNVVKGLNDLGAEGWEPWAIMDVEFGPGVPTEEHPEPEAQPIAWRVAIKRSVPKLLTM